MQFSANGELLAVGDKGGRCIVFQREKNDRSNFDYLMEFQAHEKGFDYYSSQEIPDMVTQLSWVPTARRALITSSAKEVKLWSLKTKNIVKFQSAKQLCKRGHGLQIPKCARQEGDTVASLHHTFKSELISGVHSLSVSTDKENFLSADEKSINLWNLSEYKEVFNLINFARPKGKLQY